MRWFDRLSQGLEKTRALIKRGFSSISSEDLEELEIALLSSDVGPKTTELLLEELKTKAKGSSRDGLSGLLKNSILELFPPSSDIIDRFSQGKWIILVIGVNGSGKTTTIGKLGKILKDRGKSVLFVAGDTFRAAAIEQLEIWGERAGIPVVKHREGADPGAVAFDGIKAAKSRDIDIVMIDTAGRLHTKYNLMEELKKIKRVVEREKENYEIYTLLVIDATMGQNAINQARMFNDALGIDGIAITKLDGTAKGGMVISIASELKIPVVLVGVGEGIDDMQSFNREEFVNALFWES
ncbi:MAG TPA: signal recognition particle-docking protein FtsY [bacterium]|jgi:fused signal recognition particle receptor|nr:signal recognition particle-docking protein FtsY [Dictyoglomota bacterium]HHV81454.1 signal recognition particle-docking protein FtsY [bacterium]HOK29091.1 signal recognition particle-docking protein FtsY [bacterium]HOP55554.1 signal recognition particle-docking protein FtsY [bacterium]HPO81629.1 signal recognition particle-docking protein FtsY [bacterium]